MIRPLDTIRLRLRALVRRSQLDAELDEEFQYHLDRQIEINRSAGMPPGEARTAALRAFGGLDQRKEECRDARGLRLVESTVQDVRYALRAVGNSPGFTAVAVLSLAIGIGANTTIFSFVDAVLLRPLPYPHSDRLVVLHQQPIASSAPVSVHPFNYLEWRARSRSFEALALVQMVPSNVLERDGAEQVVDAEVTAALFAVFGVQPALGRMFTDDEARPGGPALTVLGHSYWQRRFGGDPGILGRQVAVADGMLTVIGVAPAGLRVGLTEPDLYTALRIDPANPDSIGSRSFQCYGRLKAGTPLAAARAELAGIASTLAARYRLDEGYSAVVSGLHDYLVAEGRPALYVLMASVGMVLLIACANLAGLLLARGVARQGEMALRIALGATPARLVRQLVVESLTLAILGGMAGLVSAYWGTIALAALVPGTLTVGASDPVRLDATGIMFTVGLASATVLIFGPVPAWQATRVTPRSSPHLLERGGTASREQHRARAALVVVQASLAVVLLVGSGLLLRTFVALARVDPGFTQARTITMRVFLGDWPAAQRVALLEQLLERVEAVPGVKTASSIQFLPLTGMTCGTGFWLEGQIPGDPARALPTNCSIVSRDFFRAMGIAMLQGRDFDARDRADTPRVVIVNESFARRYFPDRRAIGRRVLVAGPDQTWGQVVGISGDIRHEGLTTAPAPTVFLLHPQAPGYITHLVVRTIGDPAGMTAAIRHAIHEVDRTQAVSAVKTMEQYVDESMARPRLYAVLVASFALIAVTVALVGIYGLVAYVVTRRTREIGIRMALGAGRPDVLRLVLRHVAVLVLSGLGIGLAVAAALRGLVSALLFGVSAGDPVTYLAAAVLFVAAAAVAGVVPACRAASLDPTVALRCE